MAKVDVDKLQKEIAVYLDKRAADIAAAIDSLLDEEKEIQIKADEKKAMIREQIQPLNLLHQQATGKLYIPDGTPKRSGDGGGKRRKADELKADAEKIVTFLKKNPGSSKGEISKATGLTLGQLWTKDVEKHGGVKLKKAGDKASSVYSV